MIIEEKFPCPHKRSTHTNQLVKRNKDGKKLLIRVIREQIQIMQKNNTIKGMTNVDSRDI